MSREPLLHIVLYQPEIPPNTGNIGRTCVAVGAKLWLVRPLGFSLDESQLRRAGLDYWPFLDYEVVDSWNDVLSRLPASIVEQYRSHTLQFPMYPEVRSLNLANTVCAVVYESVRQFGGIPPKC